MSRVLCAFAVNLLIALPAATAPGVKNDGKPDGPITPHQLQTSIENLKHLGLGWHNYHDVHGRFPTDFKTKDGKPGLSWRVAILPYLEQNELYKQFRLDEAWDSVHNAKLIEKMPSRYAPVRGKADRGQTFYQAFAGQQTVLGQPGQGVGLADITDGTSNTLMVVESGKAVPWTRPDDIPYDGKEVPKLGGMFDGQAHVLTADGAVYRHKKDVAAQTLRHLIERADGSVLDRDVLIDPKSDKD